MILASNYGHKKVFPDFAMSDFKINKNLKAHLQRSQLPDLDEVGRSKGPSCAEEKDLFVFYVKT